MRTTENMTSPRLGVVRKSMLRNPLFIKAPLGEARTRGLDLPGPNFIYGSTTKGSSDGGAAEALSGWKLHSRPEHPARPDFVSLNRDAVRSGVVTCKELSQYRAQRGGVTRKTRPSEQCGGGASQSHLAVPDITFGVTNRAPSPMAELLSYKYAHTWFRDQLSRNQTGNLKQQVNPVPETRTSLLRRSRALPVPQNPPRLPQVSQQVVSSLQVAPALDTFRDPKARQQALRTHGLKSRTN